MKRIMSKEEFLSVYERQQASGLTIKDFCENEAYSSSCFHYWKKKFGLSRTYTSHPDKRKHSKKCTFYTLVSIR